jgi:hypothetical protein
MVVSATKFTLAYCIGAGKAFIDEYKAQTFALLIGARHSTPEFFFLRNGAPIEDHEMRDIVRNKEDTLLLVTEKPTDGDDTVWFTKERKQTNQTLRRDFEKAEDVSRSGGLPSVLQKSFLQQLEIWLAEECESWCTLVLKNENGKSQRSQTVKNIKKLYELLDLCNVCLTRRIFLQYQFIANEPMVESNAICDAAYFNGIFGLRSRLKNDLGIYHDDSTVLTDEVKKKLVSDCFQPLLAKESASTIASNLRNLQSFQDLIHFQRGKGEFEWKKEVCRYRGNGCVKSLLDVFDDRQKQTHCWTNQKILLLVAKDCVEDFKYEWLHFRHRSEDVDLHQIDVWVEGVNGFCHHLKHGNKNVEMTLTSHRFCICTSEKKLKATGKIAVYKEQELVAARKVFDRDFFRSAFDKRINDEAYFKKAKNFVVLADLADRTLNGYSEFGDAWERRMNVKKTWNRPCQDAGSMTLTNTDVDDTEYAVRVSDIEVLDKTCLFHKLLERISTLPKLENKQDMIDKCKQILQEMECFFRVENGTRSNYVIMNGDMSGYWDFQVVFDALVKKVQAQLDMPDEQKLNVYKFVIELPFDWTVDPDLRKHLTKLLVEVIPQYEHGQFGDRDYSLWKLVIEFSSNRAVGEILRTVEWSVAGSSDTGPQCCEAKGKSELTDRSGLFFQR